MNADDIQVTDADIKEYYEKNIARVKHILVLTTDSNNSPSVMMRLPKNARRQKVCFSVPKTARILINWLRSIPKTPVQSHSLTVITSARDLF